MQRMPSRKRRAALTLLHTPVACPRQEADWTAEASDETSGKKAEGLALMGGVHRRSVTEIITASAQHSGERPSPELSPSTMEYLSALNPSGLLRSVSNVSSELGRRVWTSASPPQRPFRVCDHKRTTRKGLTAATREELLDKALEALLLSGAPTLVLEEDGTAVESEDFFQLLEDDTCLMVLGSGQSWSPSTSGVLSYGLGREKPKHSKDIARITFDVYKQNPRDLFGSLNIKATFYGLYSMSCDIQGLGPKKVLRELLRWTSTLLQGLGHALLGISSTLRHVVEGAGQWQQRGRLHPH